MGAPKNLSGRHAREYIAGGGPEAIRVDEVFRLFHDDLKVTELPSGFSCYGLDARNSKLKTLPADIQIDNRLILDGLSSLEELPPGLTVGALSLRDCTSLHALPEGLDTWFLDLEGCSRFHQWPKKANVHSGQVSLRNCIEVQTLPTWFGTLASLNLAGCIQLHEVPDGIRVSQWIDIGGTGITELPPSLADAQLRWRGVPVTPRIAFEPESITSKEALAEDNAETRRVMIERMGYLKFAQEAGAKVLDKDTDPGGERELLFIDLEEDEPLVGLSCSCPSTGRQYFLRVPPATTTCHAAAAWMAGFDDPSKYQPVQET